MSELDPVHIDDSHPCVPCFEKVVKERDALLLLLATERDRFGKKEIELMAKNDRFRKVLELIELTGGNCGHAGANVPCPCGACMAEEATRALSLGTVPLRQRITGVEKTL